jgi:hypothetical protein
MTLLISRTQYTTLRTRLGGTILAGPRGLVVVAARYWYRSAVANLATLRPSSPHQPPSIFHDT